jgi:large subunit ribosomal protein L25
MHGFAALVVRLHDQHSFGGLIDTMANTISLAAQPRDTDVKAKALRRAGIVPGVLYGPGFETQSLQFDYRALQRVVHEAGLSRLVSLPIKGKKKPETVLIREVQRDPVTDQILHIDMYRIIADQTLTTTVPLVQQGVSPAVELGGVVALRLEVLDIECLPGDLPDMIAVDLTTLEDVGARLTVADLPIPSGVTVLTPPDTDVVRIIAPRAEEVEEEVEVEIEGEEIEGEAPAEEGETETEEQTEE